MAKLQISTGQAAVVGQLEPFLQDAFLNGIEDVNLNPVLDALPLYPLVGEEARTKIKNAIKSLLASIIKTMNVRQVLPIGISGVVPLARLTEFGAEGSLTFVDGFLVAKVDPT